MTQARKAITSALTLPAAGASAATSYLFQGTFAMPYTASDGGWKPSSPTGLPQHVSALWQGLAGTAGHRPYTASFTAQGEIYFLRPGHLVRYSIDKGQVESDPGAKPENTFKLAPEFLNNLSAAMDANGGVYLFSGTDYAFCRLSTGKPQKTGKLSAPGLSHVDAALWPKGSTTGFLFCGESYATCTADADGTLKTGSTTHPIAGTWPTPPLGRPRMVALLSSSNTREDGLATIVHTDIDLSTDTHPAQPATTPSWGGGSSGPRGSIAVGPDGWHAYMISGDAKLFAMDLRKATKAPDAVIRAVRIADYMKAGGRIETDYAALSPLGTTLWVTDQYYEKTKPAHVIRVADVSAIDTANPTVKEIDPQARTSGITFSPNGEHVFVIHWQGNDDGKDDGVLEIDAAERTIIRDYKAKNLGGGIAVSRDSSQIYTQAGAGATKILKINTRVDPPTVTTPVSIPVWRLAMTPDRERICMPASHDSAVIILHIKDDTTITVKIPDAETPHSVAIDPNGRYAYVTDALKTAVWIIDLDTEKCTGSIAIDQKDAKGRGFFQIGLGWDWT
ncbi:hypothetical protein ACSNOH_01515 [Streptomyces sp. URMC 127]|uniref:YncE family protein n=1 Tax=Streptomyces sp. URMC 127 TaxID=3423402 RepID=UPI003F1BF960